MELCKQLTSGAAKLNAIVQTIDFDGWKLIGIVRTTNFRGRPRNQLLEKCRDLVPIHCIVIDTPDYMDTTHNKA